MAHQVSSGEEARRRILDDVFETFHRDADYPNVDQFRLDHYDEELAVIDSLERDGVLRLESGRYIFRLGPYVDSAFWKHEVKAADRLFPLLKKLYFTYREKGFPADELVKNRPIGVRPKDLKRVLIILSRLDLVRGMTRAQNAAPNDYLTYCVPERIRYFKNLGQVVEDARRNRHYDLTGDISAPTAQASLPSLFSKKSMFESLPGFAGYEAHPAIAKVSGKLFENGHYAEAVEAALKAVISRVKASVIAMGEKPADGGDGMMGIAFGSDKRQPLINFNGLATREEQDEHRGIFFLFKGIVGIRNRKAHENVVLKDPQRAADYLHLASLLMRLLDLSGQGGTGSAKKMVRGKSSVVAP